MFLIFINIDLHNYLKLNKKILIFFGILEINIEPKFPFYSLFYSLYSLFCSLFYSLFKGLIAYSKAKLFEQKILESDPPKNLGLQIEILTLYPTQPDFICNV